MSETALFCHKNSSGSDAVECSPNVLIGGIPVLREGDHFADGSRVESGAPHVFINSKPGARLGDPVTGGRIVAQGYPGVVIGNYGGGGFGLQTRFKNIFGMLQSQLTEKERLLFCIPHIAKAMATKEKNINEAQGWLYLHTMMMKWLSGPVNRNAQNSHVPFFIDWDWVMGLGEYMPIKWAQPPLPRFPYIGFFSSTSFQQEYEAFIHPETQVASVSNVAARTSLGNILKRDNKLKSHAEDFDYISSPWNDWEDKYHTLRRIPQPVGIGGQQAALGAFSMRALAKGRVTPEGNKHRICVTDIAVFAHDVFNFAASDYEWLSFWSCIKNDVSLTPGIGYFQLHNEDFRAYQDRHGFGHDYLVLSQPHRVENFLEVSYEYP